MNQRLVLLGAAAVLLAAYALTDKGGLLLGLGSALWRDAGTSDGGNLVPPQATQSQALGKPVTLNPLEGLSAQDFAAITERPLFNPGRRSRPPVVEQAAPAPQEPVKVEAPAPAGPKPGDYKLLGISSGAGGKIAALRVMASGEVLYLHEGETVDDWNVLNIGERSVTIGDEDHQIRLSLFAGDEADAGASAAPEAVAGE